jgi:hypothetical protein
MKIIGALAFFMAMQPVSAFMAPSTKAASKTALSKMPPSKNTDNRDLQNIFYQNQAWKAMKLVEDPDFFKKLGSTHTPEFMWIGRY